MTEEPDHDCDGHHVFGQGEDDQDRRSRTFHLDAETTACLSDTAIRWTNEPLPQASSCGDAIHARHLATEVCRYRLHPNTRLVLLFGGPIKLEFALTGEALPATASLNLSSEVMGSALSNWM
jgi:hypothetical protein